MAILMSGVGSNANSLLLQRHWFPTIEIALIATDIVASGAASLGAQHGVPVVSFPGPITREHLFREIAEVFRSHAVTGVLYCGFMRIAPAWFTEAFPGVNIHPADLEVRGQMGLPAYRGMTALQDALRAGEQSVASSMHIVSLPVDAGVVLAVSSHVPTKTDDVATLHEELKTREHFVYPRVVALLACDALLASQLPLREADGDVARAFLRLERSSDSLT